MAAAGDPRGGEIPMRSFMLRPEDVFPHAWGFEEKYKQLLCRLFSDICGVLNEQAAEYDTFYVIHNNEKKE